MWPRLLGMFELPAFFNHRQYTLSTISFILAVISNCNWVCNTAMEYNYNVSPSQTINFYFGERYLLPWVSCQAIYIYIFKISVWISNMFMKYTEILKTCLVSESYHYRCGKILKGNTIIVCNCGIAFLFLNLQQSRRRYIWTVLNL